MNRRHLLLALVLVSSAVAVPARAQVERSVQHFDEGNELYRDGRYDAALQAYQRALDDGGYASGALYYNMGNAFFRLDQLGQAIRYYERARLLVPDSPELLHNIDIARNRTADDFSQIPTPFWKRWWHALVGFAGIDGLFVTGILLYLLAAALLAHRIWTRSRNPWRRRALTLSSLFGLMLLVLAFAAAVERQQYRRGVVVVDAVSLHEEPQQEAPTELDVHEGLLVDVLGERGRWMEVRLPNGATGWVDTQAVGEI